MIGTTWKLTQATTWIVVFAAQPKARLSDEGVAEFMSKEFPDSPRCAKVETVRDHRSLYNRGKIVGQQGKPAKQIAPYDDEGTELSA